MADALLRSSETMLCAKSGIADQAGLRLSGLPAEITKTEGITDHGILTLI
ncbi:hypothetical protein ACU8MG_24990 (plasmid) [Rhizobium leguminosarum]